MDSFTVCFAFKFVFLSAPTLGTFILSPLLYPKIFFTQKLILPFHYGWHYNNYDNRHINNGCMVPLSRHCLSAACPFRYYRHTLISLTCRRLGFQAWCCVVMNIYIYGSLSTLKARPHPFYYIFIYNSRKRLVILTRKLSAKVIDSLRVSVISALT